MCLTARRRQHGAWLRGPGCVGLRSFAWRKKEGPPKRPFHLGARRRLHQLRQVAGRKRALTEPSEVWALELVIDGLSDLGKRWPWSDWIEAAVPRILEGPHGPAVIERLRGLVAS